MSWCSNKWDLVGLGLVKGISMFQVRQKSVHLFGWPTVRPFSSSSIVVACVSGHSAAQWKTTFPDFLCS